MNKFIIIGLTLGLAIGAGVLLYRVATPQIDQPASAPNTVGSGTKVLNRTPKPRLKSPEFEKHKRSNTHDWDRVKQILTDKKRDKQDDAYLNSAIAALSKWAEEDILDFLEWSTGQDDSIVKLAAGVVTDLLEQTPPEARYAMINTILGSGSLPSGIARKVHRKAVEYLFEYDRKNLLNYAVGIHEAESDIADEMLGSKLGEQELEVLLAELGKTGSRKRINKIISVFVDISDSMNPGGTARWVNEIEDDSLRGHLIGKVLLSWKLKNEAQAAAWAKANLRPMDLREYGYMFTEQSKNTPQPNR